MRNIDNCEHCGIKFYVKLPLRIVKIPKYKFLDENRIKIGKKVLDNLIEGMYTDSLFMYREYVQNSTDAIGEAVRMGLLENRRHGSQDQGVWLLHQLVAPMGTSS